MNLMKFRQLYFLISLVFIIPGVISLIMFGLKPAIDFTGGSLLELQLEDPAQTLPADLNDKIQIAVGDAFEIGQIQISGDNSFIIRDKFLEPASKQQLVASISENFQPVQEVRFETVGPALGRELLNKALIAIVIVAGAITLYVWRQFSELKFGVCAILAMLHDSLVLLGSFSLFGYFWGVEVDVLFVTALLTTLSFSVHDTIVVYDRIRELRKLHPKLSFVALVNAAVVQTLGRSINNSVTIIIMLVALTLLGGETIRLFALALLIGAITGTYSSTFTAAPLLLLWDDLRARFKH